MLIWGLLYVANMMLCVALASNKNHNGLKALVASFLFGIFATLYYLGAAKVETNPKTNQSEENQKDEHTEEESSIKDRSNRVSVPYVGEVPGWTMGISGLLMVLLLPLLMTYRLDSWLVNSLLIPLWLLIGFTGFVYGTIVWTR